MDSKHDRLPTDAEGAELMAHDDYRPPWWPVLIQRMNCGTVLDLALALHMNTTGSSADLTAAKHAKYVHALRHAIDTWRPTTLAKCARFDRAVKALLVAALAEVQAERRNFRRMLFADVNEKRTPPTPAAPAPPKES